MDENSVVAGARNVILGVAIAAIAANAFALGGYGFWDAIVGVLLFLVLVEYWRVKLPSLSLRWAFSLAFSYVLIMIFGFIFDTRLPFLVNENGMPTSILETVLANDTFDFYRGVSVLVLWACLGAVGFLWRRKYN